jgi:hypothetical protein
MGRNTINTREEFIMNGIGKMRRGSTVNFNLDGEVLKGKIIQFSKNGESIALQFGTIIGKRVIVPIEKIIEVTKY